MEADKKSPSYGNGAFVNESGDVAILLANGLPTSHVIFLPKKLAFGYHFRGDGFSYLSILQSSCLANKNMTE
jgi:hypothetical protein